MLANLINVDIEIFYNFNDISPFKNCEVLEADYDENSDSFKIKKIVYKHFKK